MFDVSFDTSSRSVLKCCQTQEDLCELSISVFLRGGAGVRELLGVLSFIAESKIVMVLPSEARGRLEAMITDTEVKKRVVPSMLSYTALKKKYARVGPGGPGQKKGPNRPKF